MSSLPVIKNWKLRCWICFQYKYEYIQNLVKNNKFFANLKCAEGAKSTLIHRRYEEWSKELLVHLYRTWIISFISIKFLITPFPELCTQFVFIRCKHIREYFICKNTYWRKLKFPRIYLYSNYGLPQHKISHKFHFILEGKHNKKMRRYVMIQNSTETRHQITTFTVLEVYEWYVNPYPTAFPYGNGMVLHFYQQQESSTTKTVHKVINKGLKTYV